MSDEMVNITIKANDKENIAIICPKCNTSFNAPDELVSPDEGKFICPHCDNQIEQIMFPVSDTVEFIHTVRNIISDKRVTR